MKHCKKCGQEKPLEEFPKAGVKAGYKDNHTNTCKTCSAVDVNTYYRKTWFKSQSRMKHYESRLKGIPCDLNEDYLKEIWTDNCPVYGVPFVMHIKAHPNCPTLDRLDPELGYVKGNVVYISSRANRIKYNATVEELRRIADWFEGATTSRKTYTQVSGNGEPDESQ